MLTMSILAIGSQAFAAKNYAPKNPFIPDKDYKPDLSYGADNFYKGQNIYHQNSSLNNANPFSLCLYLKKPIMM